MKKNPLLRSALLLALTLGPLPALLAEEDDLNSLPPAVQKTARAQVGQNEIEEVEDTFEDGKRAYEVEFTRKGEKLAVVISEHGQLLQTEHRLSVSDTPAKIKAAVLKKFPQGQISHFVKVEKAGQTLFEVTVETGGKVHHLKLDAEGGELGAEKK